MDYNKLLDEWAEKVFEKADKAMKLSEDSKENSYEQGYRRGYSNGLRMAISILSQMEKVQNKI